MIGKLRRGLAAFALLSLAGVAGESAAASGYDALYSFCSQANCADGGDGIAGLLRDPSGTLYGAALFGGVHNQEGGTIFALVPVGASWQYQLLYTFCSQLNCTDGQIPTSGLIEDVDGNLYGTTSQGGIFQRGTLFKLTHNAGRTSWTLTPLYSFCASAQCADGAGPNSRLTYRGAASGAPYDGVSPLYGAVQEGGSGNGGIVYQFTPSSGGSGTYAVIANLCNGTDCSAGSTPSGGLVADSSGNLFLNAGTGGDANDGTVVELANKRGTWKMERLYSFCAAKKCKDGARPAGPIALDAGGNLFGTTLGGGRKNSGTLFELSGRKWKEQVLYRFCAVRGCPDGAEPLGVGMDGSGNLIGTTQAGGTSASVGAAYRFGGGTFDVLYQFCPDIADACPDGAQPESPPVADGSGNLFGTTYQGGSVGAGVIYEITP